MQHDNRNETNTVLELKNVSVFSPSSIDEILIEGINWTVNRKDFWIVAGQSGVGKTALLLTSAGIQKPAAGDIFIFGKNIKSLPENELIRLRLKIGFIFEGGGRLFHNLTVEENIALPLRYHLECDTGVVYAKVYSLMEFAGIEKYRDALPSELPKHLLPRVGLARALITEPELIFIDDPIKNLDLFQERWWVDTILKILTGNFPVLKQEPTVIVTVSDLRPWKEYIHKIAVLTSMGYKCFNREEIMSGKPGISLDELFAGII